MLVSVPSGPDVRYSGPCPRPRSARVLRPLDQGPRPAASPPAPPPRLAQRSSSLHGAAPALLSLHQGHLIDIHLECSPEFRTMEFWRNLTEFSIPLYLVTEFRKIP